MSYDNKTYQVGVYEFKRYYEGNDVGRKIWFAKNTEQNTIHRLSDLTFDVLFQACEVIKAGTFKTAFMALLSTKYNYGEKIVFAVFGHGCFLVIKGELKFLSKENQTWEFDPIPNETISYVMDNPGEIYSNQNNLFRTFINYVSKIPCPEGFDGPWFKFQQDSELNWQLVDKETNRVIDFDPYALAQIQLKPGFKFELNSLIAYGVNAVNCNIDTFVVFCHRSGVINNTFSKPILSINNSGHNFFIRENSEWMGMIDWSLDLIDEITNTDVPETKDKWFNFNIKNLKEQAWCETERRTALLKERELNAVQFVLIDGVIYGHKGTLGWFVTDQNKQDMLPLTSQSNEQIEQVLKSVMIDNYSSLKQKLETILKKRKELENLKSILETEELNKQEKVSDDKFYITGPFKIRETSDGNLFVTSKRLNISYNQHQSDFDSGKEVELNSLSPIELTTVGIWLNGPEHKHLADCVNKLLSDNFKERFHHQRIFNEDEKEKPGIRITELPVTVDKKSELSLLRQILLAAPVGFNVNLGYCSIDRNNNGWLLTTPTNTINRSDLDEIIKYILTKLW